ncbi:MAG: hypothetical protein NT169_20380 [Chloroflexi bacterium]|nr:hypothetical protein [Chloroflexota bacterium]
MGPIEIVFVVLLILFAVYGVVRGYAKELGVTLLLLLALFVVVFVESSYKAQLNAKVLGPLFNLDPNNPALDVTRNLIYCGFLIVITYASYQGETLAYPGPRKSPLWGLGVGLLNGYLFAGSLWHYLAKANWPLLKVNVEQYTAFYKFAIDYLPPAIFGWKHLIALVTILLILRVWK